MKKLSHLLLSPFFCLLLNPAFGQEEIQFGSNNGEYISIFSTKIYYEEYGEGPVLLLLHGGLGSIHNFAKVIPGLSDQFRVIAIDSPGHGRSEQADSLSYKLMASYYSEFIDLLKLDSVYIIGYSDGGNTALILASDRPDKVKRILTSGADSNTDGYSNEARNFIKMLNPEFVETYLQDWLTDYLNKSPQKDQWKKFILDSQKMWLEEVVISDSELGEIKGRALIVLGDRDMITLEHGIHMFRTIKGSEFCVLPNTPHEVFFANPDLINLIAIDFLSKK
jgi:pimeloyl-ACP methyl ester carboxylesterase